MIRAHFRLQLAPSKIWRCRGRKLYVQMILGALRTKLLWAPPGLCYHMEGSGVQSHHERDDRRRQPTADLKGPFDRLEASTAASAIPLLHSSPSAALVAHPALPPPFPITHPRRRIEPIIISLFEKQGLPSSCAFCTYTAFINCPPCLHSLCYSPVQDLSCNRLNPPTFFSFAFAANEAHTTRRLIRGFPGGPLGF